VVVGVIPAALAPSAAFRSHYRAGMPTPIRVLLVDDHEVVLHGLIAMLSRFADQVRSSAPPRNLTTP